MANAHVVLDFSRWPEVVHEMRRAVVRALEAEAEISPPDVADALIRVAARFDAGLTNAAALRPNDV
jgi:hypothetical protein